MLDLKNQEVDSNNPSGANANKGLLPPRVNLQAVDNLQPEGATYTGDDIHVGLMVFNLKEKPREGLCKSVYIWTGIEWKNIGKDG